VADDILQIHIDKIGIHEPEPMLSRDPFEPWECDLESFVLGNISVPGRLRKELGFFKPLIRRAFLEEHKLRYDENLRLGEDYDLYARAMALRARFLVAPACGYVSVNRDDSLSARHSKGDLEKLRDSNLQLLMLQGLTQREKQAIIKHYHSIDSRIQWLNVIEAVKSRSISSFLGATFRSRQSALFVTARLREQLIIRSLRRLGMQ
jgi:succinoglycan biosynthesis protein ExoU